MESATQADREKPVALLHDDYEIICVTTNLALNGVGGQLYPAKRIGKNETNLIAIVGDRTSCFHLDIADAVENIKSKSLLTLHRWGICEWPGGGQKVALIYEQPPGGTLVDALAKGRIFSDAEIKKSILPSALDVLSAFAAKSLTHGAIRPDNMYLKIDNSVVLGECLSTAPSQFQPVQFLTVERGMAVPFGRGIGTTSDDIYALGVTLLCLATGEIPLGSVGEDDIITRKMEHGSFNAFDMRSRLSTSMSTLLRGMLNDNADERWTLAEISHWVHGQQLAATHKATGRKASRPLRVDGVDYFDKHMMARALFRNLNELGKLIENGELIKWVRRALADTHLEERLTKATNPPSLQRKVGTPEGKIMTRILMAFHPSAPIRYHKLAVMPDGLSTLLFKAVANGDGVKTISEILLADFPSFWYSLQHHLAPAQADYMNRLEYATRMLERYGVERCVYETALWAPYLGEGFQGHFVFTPHQYILALEDIAGTARQPATPIDKHAAAFLAARDARFGDSIIDRINVSLNETDGHLIMLQTLATLQGRFNIAKLPNLSAWFNTLLQSAIDRYHNRQNREKVRYELRIAAQQGDLALMLEAIENPSWIIRDKQGFMQAREEHALLGLEAQTLKVSMEPHSNLFPEIGREASTVVAGIISIFLAICFLSMRMV